MIVSVERVRVGRVVEAVDCLRAIGADVEQLERLPQAEADHIVPTCCRNLVEYVVPRDDQGEVGRGLELQGGESLECRESGRSGRRHVTLVETFGRSRRTWHVRLLAIRELDGIGHCRTDNVSVLSRDSTQDRTLTEVQLVYAVLGMTLGVCVNSLGLRFARHRPGNDPGRLRV